MAQPDFSPSAERNKHPILERLQALVPAQGHALEIASGTGQHVCWFAQHMPDWTWQPTEVHRGALYNIEVRAAEAGLDNVLEALQLDVCREPWTMEPAGFDLVLCINMLHIAPWEACGALMRGSTKALNAQGLLITYGPYFEDGVVPLPSNQEFDQSLRTHDPSWGIRTVAAVQDEAQAAGLRLQARIDMPANNLLLVWAKA
ncbi:DUF938 domain-containing protein [Rhodoferax aquaticus]|uniref:DUF938 domain-containing protein n=1 Tax=Rhodoferax aquaticus TaxID=2527691 RepID=A0A515EQV8_9BURK|nr:DUF938 domain-containing protein [Rhodoferax aquaticus]QDL55047.1 DUF938 domain-containing protein [Rhodoferax aquaticus]